MSERFELQNILESVLFLKGGVSKSKKSVKVQFLTVFNNIENALDIMLNEKQAR